MKRASPSFVRVFSLLVLRNDGVVVVRVKE